MASLTEILNQVLQKESKLQNQYLPFSNNQSTMSHNLESATYESSVFIPFLLTFLLKLRVCFSSPLVSFSTTVGNILSVKSRIVDTRWYLM